MTTRFLAVLLLCGFATSAAGQSDKTPKRPTLPGNGDVNDPAAYYALGKFHLENEPDKAEAAFYWATRLDPTWAEPLYARRVAMLLQDRRRLVRYNSGDRNLLRSKEILQIDSLQFRALMLNPFLYRNLDRLLLYKYFETVFEDAMTRSGQRPDVNPAALDFFIRSYLASAAPWLRAWLAYTNGDLQAAIDAYGSAIKSSPERARSQLYADRARIFYMLGTDDSAHSDLKLAIEKLRKREEKDIVYFYESKALYEYSIGLVLERMNDFAGAREAYGRALQEDLSFHPAHLATARLALAAGDTTAAVAAMDLAVQIRPDDAGVRSANATVLRRIGRSAEAETQLRKAIELEPMFSSPYFALAQTLDARGEAAAAAEQYRTFLERTAKNDQRRTVAEQRLKALSGPARPSGGT